LILDRRQAIAEAVVQVVNISNGKALWMCFPGHTERFVVQLQMLISPEDTNITNYYQIWQNCGFRDK
jgi:hypothetical protein